MLNITVEKLFAIRELALDKAKELSRKGDHSDKIEFYNSIATDINNIVVK